MDYSFLTLSDTLSEATNIGNPKTATIVNNCPIQLLPNVSYVQVTERDINLGMDYEVFIIDCSGEILADITEYVAVQQESGFAFEIAALSLPGLDFYRDPIHLKFTHPPSGQEWFTNKFNLTSYQDKTTTTFYYEYASVDPDSEIKPFSIFKSITVRCRFTQVDPEKQFSAYQSKGNDTEISSLPHTFNRLIYVFDQWDNKTYMSMVYLFNSTRVYIEDDYGRFSRVTANTVIEKEAIPGETNVFSGGFTVPVSYKDQYIPSFQIFKDLALTLKSPKSPPPYTLTSLPGVITGTFNYPVTLGTGTFTIYDDDGVFHTFTQDDITVVGNVFTIDISGLTFVNGNYYNNFTLGLFVSNLGQSISITNETDWAFNIGVGDWLTGDWDDLDWFTNL